MKKPPKHASVKGQIKGQIATPEVITHLYDGKSINILLYFIKLVKYIEDLQVDNVMFNLKRTPGSPFFGRVRFCRHSSQNVLTHDSAEVTTSESASYIIIYIWSQLYILFWQQSIENSKLPSFLQCKGKHGAYIRR